MRELTLNKILTKAENCLEVSESSFEKKRYEFCVDRAYYAMFHSIQALLFISGVRTKTHAGSHTKFQELFIRREFWDAKLNVSLHRTFKRKLNSEYEYNKVLAEDAKESFEDANRFVNATMQYLKENNHLQ